MPTRNLKIVIITATHPRHLNLCGSLADKWDLVGVLHPKRPPNRPSRRLSKLYRQAKSQGLPLALLRLLGVMGREKPGSAQHALEAKLFSAGAERYGRLPPEIIHADVNVQDPATVNLIRRLNPDVTLCLGGPIYPRTLISASPLTLNFHSGISPLYNGSSSIDFAFAYGHPHCCGGTLMKMNETIDGGEILAHYLPSIEKGDSALSLFAKTVAAAPLMYENVLQSLASHPQTPISSIPQPNPYTYTRSYQFGWYHSAMARKHAKEALVAKHLRTEVVSEYWNIRDPVAARDACRKFVLNLVWP